MNCLVVGRPARILESGSLEKTSQVLQRDPAVNLDQCPLDDVLELEGVYRSRTRQRQEVTPGFRGKPAPLVRSHHSESHWLWNAIIHFGLTWLRAKGWQSGSASVYQRERILPNLFYKLFSVKDFCIDHEIGLFI